MIHLGDITKMTPDKTPAVDCITFGSPCQDLSVAGKRAGLAGERSGLFMDAVKVIKNMRAYSFGQYPKFAVWENVPGAFSSNKGEDFRVVLEELARICEAGVSIPGPEKGKWKKSGFIAGDRWSIAWRTLDALYWGVPQRRKRIALVMDLGGQRAGEILFERTGVSGHLEPCIPPWKGVARNPAACTAGYDRVVEREDGRAYTLKIRSGCEGGGKGALVQTEKSATLSTLQDQTLFVLQGNAIDRDVKQNGSGIAESETMFTLNATDRHGVCCLLNDQGGSYLNVENGDVSPTLRAESHAHEPVVLCRASGQANAETFQNCSPTLSCNHEQPVVFDARGNGDGATAPTLTGDHENRITDYTAVLVEPRMKQQICAAEAYCLRLDNGSSDPFCGEKISPTIRQGAGSNGCANVGVVTATSCKKPLRWIVRRLTTVECERLQGYPDGWTDIGEWYDEKGKMHKPADSPRYKAMGNSIALPQWWWLVCKMAKYLPEKPALGSLFDGVGGFPLVWETRFGEGTAVWASEIEPFPIAVTKIRFPEK